jgi:radical SAM protein with 4Fe4S-binding SPASM domain
MNRIQTLINTVRAYWAFLKRKTDLKYPPVRLWIEITGVCNLKCIMCPQSRRKDIGHMPVELFKKIIDEASDFVFDIKFNVGGEPTLHPNFEQMLQYAKEKGIDTEMHTNATVLTEEKSLKILQSGLDVISFSLDTFDPTIYEASRIGGKFERTRDNIKRFLELKKEGGYRKPHTIIQLLHIPGLSEDKDSSEKSVRSFYRGFPFDEIKTIKAHNIGGKVRDSESGKVMFEFQHFDPHPCGDVYHAMSIKWSGAVVPCCTDFLDQYLLGDLNSSSLLEIWNNGQFRTLRKALVEGRYRDIPLCADCESACNKLPLLLPTNMLGMARSVIGRNSLIAKVETLTRKYVLLR